MMEFPAVAMNRSGRAVLGPGWHNPKWGFALRRGDSLKFIHLHFQLLLAPRHLEKNDASPSRSWHHRNALGVESRHAPIWTTQLPEGLCMSGDSFYSTTLGLPLTQGCNSPIA